VVAPLGLMDIRGIMGDFLLRAQNNVDADRAI
jgi:hypothetical protein